jgi:hypothetical protein
MRSRGRLSPWITPHTIRPPCSHGISKLTSAPAPVLPTRMQVPRPRNPSTASRNTAGTAGMPLRWRDMDSNFRFRAKDGRLGYHAFEIETLDLRRPPRKCLCGS